MAREPGVSTDANLQQEVSVRSAPRARKALASNPKRRPVGDAGRDLDIDLRRGARRTAESQSFAPAERGGRESDLEIMLEIATLGRAGRSLAAESSKSSEATTTSG